MDECDFAQARIERESESMLKAARGCVPVPGQGARDCDECGSRLKPARSKLGYRICVDCAAEREARAAGFVA